MSLPDSKAYSASVQFARGYVSVFLLYLAISLGSLFFVMLHHLARAGWSASLRRIAEALSGNLPWLGLFFFGTLTQFLISGMCTPPARSGRTTTYFSLSWIILRFVVYFTTWSFLAWFFRSQSIQQDTDHDVRHSKAMERMAAVGMVLFGVTVTLAAVDLIMSLTPGWTSTAVGVYFFSDAMISSLAAIILLAVWLQSRGYLRDVITPEHYHDLGKLLFAFVVFWGYIAFSQYMLIWYANMPGETRFYLPRQQGPWATVSLVLLFGNLLIPMCGLLSRNVKRRKGILAFWAAWLLLTVLLDFFWLVVPSVPSALESGKAASLAALDPRAIGMFIALVAVFGVVLFSNTLRLLRKAPLVPVGDPRLEESLAFENI